MADRLDLDRPDTPEEPVSLREVLSEGGTLALLLVLCVVLCVLAYGVENGWVSL